MPIRDVGTSLGHREVEQGSGDRRTVVTGQPGREADKDEIQRPALLAAPDKFRGTASAQQVSGAMAKGAAALGWSVCQMPLSDGGDGLLDVLAGRGGRCTRSR